MPTLVDQVRAAVALRSEIEFAVLFGSAASGTMGPSSDIDLAVRFAPGMTPQSWDFGGLVAALEATLKRRVDLVDLSRTQSTLLCFEVAKGMLVKGDFDHFVAFKARAFRNWREFGPRFRRMATALADKVASGARSVS